MNPTEDKPKTDAPKDDKTTPPQELPPFSAREAARIWGVSSDGQNGMRRRFAYSKT
jgi:hypothetical protein